MIHVEQFRTLVVRPTLTHMRLWSPSAETLLVATAIHESGLRYLAQLGNGPARGLFQIEPDTHEDVWVNYVKYRPVLAARLDLLAADVPSRLEQLTTNPAYACAIARLVYYRRPESLPAADDIPGLAAYWKRHFNTAKGRGSVSAFILNFKEHMQ